MRQDPLDELLPFYAGLTKLASDKSRAVLLKVLKSSLDDGSIARELQKDPTVQNDPRRRALALFRCLYECQELSDTLMVKANLQSEWKTDNLIRYVISFKNMRLSPLECLAVGYFVRYKSRSIGTLCGKESTIILGLEGCSISDTSISILIQELKRDISGRTSGRVKVMLAENKFSTETLLMLKKLLEGQSNIEGLGVQKCFGELNMMIALKYIIEGLSSKSSCREIAIGYNGLNQSHIYHLVLMIRSCTQLRVVNLSSSTFDSNVMRFFGKAVSLSQLCILQLSHCDLDDKMLTSLGKEISHSSVLECLEIFDNPRITPDGYLNLYQHLLMAHLI